MSENIGGLPPQNWAGDPNTPAAIAHFAGGKTPWQAAYEVWRTPGDPAWEDPCFDDRDAWQAIARAVLLHTSPELRATMAERDEARAETRQLRDLTAEILAAFGPSGSGHTARVGQVQIAKWRERAGLGEGGGWRAQAVSPLAAPDGSVIPASFRVSEEPDGEGSGTASEKTSPELHTAIAERDEARKLLEFAGEALEEATGNAAEAHQLRMLVAEILNLITPVGTPFATPAAVAQIAEWRQRAAAIRAGITKLSQPVSREMVEAKAAQLGVTVEEFIADPFKAQFGVTVDEMFKAAT